MIDDIIQDAEERMQKSITSLEESLKKIRTGRAHPSILDSIMVSYYGSDTCLLYTSPSPRDRQKSRMPSSA